MGVSRGPRRRTPHRHSSPSLSSADFLSSFVSTSPMACATECLLGAATLFAPEGSTPLLLSAKSPISVSDPESYLFRMTRVRFGRRLGRSQHSCGAISSSSLVSGGVSGCALLCLPVGLR